MNALATPALFAPIAAPPAWRAFGDVVRALLFRLWIAALIEGRRHA